MCMFSLRPKTLPETLQAIHFAVSSVVPTSVESERTFSAVQCHIEFCNKKRSCLIDA